MWDIPCRVEHLKHNRGRVSNQIESVSRQMKSVCCTFEDAQSISCLKKTHTCFLFLFEWWAECWWDIEYGLRSQRCVIYFLFSLFSIAVVACSLSLPSDKSLLREPSLLWWNTTGSTPADLAFNVLWVQASTSQCASSWFGLLLLPLVRGKEDRPMRSADGTRSGSQQAEGCAL